MSSQLDKNSAALAALIEYAESMPTVSGGELQEKTVEPTETPQQITPDNGYDGLSKVTVGAIPDKYYDTSDATATSTDIVESKTAYINGGKVIGTNPYAKAATDAEVSVQGELIAQIQSALASKSSVSPRLQEKNVTPTAEGLSVIPDIEYDGLSKVTVNGDVNLVPENIAEGVSIFGVLGTMVASGELKYASGQYALSANGKEISVNGVGFTPAVVFYRHSTSYGTFGFGCADAVFVTYSGSMSATFTANDDGFTFASTNNSYIVSKATYYWYAFGM